MKYNISKSIEILERTPGLLEIMLHGLSNEWLKENEGGKSWSPFDILGHLIHGEKTDWIPRMNIILSDKVDKTFVPFNRFAQFNDSQGKTTDDLLNEFKFLREKNIGYLRSQELTDSDLLLKAQHPELGTVTLAELLASWVVHDLNHIAQICRVMAFQYKEEVGPWQAYMGILKS